MEGSLPGLSKGRPPSRRQSGPAKPCRSRAGVAGLRQNGSAARQNGAAANRLAFRGSGSLRRIAWPRSRIRTEAAGGKSGIAVKRNHAEAVRPELADKKTVPAGTVNWRASAESGQAGSGGPVGRCLPPERRRANPGLPDGSRNDRRHAPLAGRGPIRPNPAGMPLRTNPLSLRWHYPDQVRRDQGGKPCLSLSRGTPSGLPGIRPAPVRRWKTDGRMPSPYSVSNNITVMRDPVNRQNET